MADTRPVEPEQVDVEPVLAVQVEATSGTRPEEIGDAMRGAFETIERYAETHGVTFKGPPRAIYRRFDDNGTEFVVAFPVSADAGVAADDRVSVGELPGGRALRFTHTGPYEHLAETYAGIMNWLRVHGRVKEDADWARHGPMWDEYVSDPTTTRPADLRTHIYVPDPPSDHTSGG